jgi:photosystem II stability/assembly factor-like uncharacterized protein
MFSIIVDPRHPDVVYASACSGMYKSVNKAEYFHRIYMSLPTPAHRTRVMKQDTQRSNIVYGGTVAGLWKSLDGGDHWKLVTDPDVVVNDVLVDPANPEHVLVATDRGGVLASNDGFAHYATSNRGFAHRVIGGMVADNKDPNRIFVGVVNDKDLGGFFISDDGGSSWRQSNRGLDERDILSLQQARDGVMFAGTNHGVFYLTSLNGEWQPATMIRGALPEPEEKPVETKTKTTAHAGKKGAPTKTTHTVAHKSAPAEKTIPLAQAPRILAFDLDGDKWYAATNDGVFVSSDKGRKWYSVMVPGETEFIAVNTLPDGSVGLLAPKHAYISHDEGKSWSQLAIPQYVTGLYNLTQGGDGSIWLGTREGALHSTDNGVTWEHVLGGLPPRQVYVVRYDAPSQRLLATAQHTHGVYESKDGGKSWHLTSDTGVSIRAALNFQGRILAASSYNGLLLQQGDGSAVASNATQVGGTGATR